MRRTPRRAILPCPFCQSRDHLPQVRVRGFFFRSARIECDCGVSGAWRAAPRGRDPWNEAIHGWEAIAGEVGDPEAPQIRCRGGVVYVPPRRRRREGAP